MNWLADLLKDVPLSGVLKEKLLSLQEKLIICEDKCAALEAANANLKQQLADTQEQNAIANKRIDDLQQQFDNLSQIDSLDDVKQKILVLLAQQDRLTAHHLEQLLQLPKVTVEYHLEILETGQYIYRQQNLRAHPPKFSLLQKGREIVVMAGLV